MGERSEVNGWQADKGWSDRFMPEIKARLGQHLIGEPPIEEDVERNTDLVVLMMKPVRIAVRIRRNDALLRYGGQFTIRAERPSGAKTELAKIRDGWGDFIFYGFCDAEERRLARWIIGDLAIFREHPEVRPCDVRQNHDGSGTLFAYTWRSFPRPFVVAYQAWPS